MRARAKSLPRTASPPYPIGGFGGLASYSRKKVIVRSLGVGVNSAPLIQAALDSAYGRGVDVVLPDRRYDVWPAPANGVWPGKDCLRVNHSNVALYGAGRDRTEIRCFVAGGLDPNTNWELVYEGQNGPYVWRGPGLALTGSVITNFKMAGIRLNGSSPRNLITRPVWGPSTPNGESFPANPITGDGWDITNKGVMVGNGTTRTNTLFEDCEIDSFRGENFYYGGGAGNQNMVTRRCSIHDSIGSLFSCSGGLTVERCDIYYGLNAVENTPLTDTQRIIENYIHDCAHGITVPSNQHAQPFGDCLVARNTVRKCWGWGAAVLGALRFVTFSKNIFIDGPGFGALLMGGGGGVYEGPYVTVEDNIVALETYTSNVPAMYANSDPGSPINYIIRRNRGQRSKLARDAGAVITGVSYNLWNPGQDVILDEDNNWSA